MAIYDSVSTSIYEAESLNNNADKFKVSWEGKSGKNVEDYITRRLKEIDGHNIVQGSYDTDSETLTLTKADGSTVEAEVTVQTPTYIYGIISYGIRIDGVVYKDPKVLMQYRNGRKIELGIAIRSVAERSGKQSTINKPFDVTINLVSNNENKTVR
jgi:hypothetical protein